jgi:putative OPT family oligopeptide transporter
MPEDPKSFKPFVSPSESPPEFTVAPVVVGTLLGIVFGASSMYLVLKVGLTVSASIPVAVLSFALFRVLSGAFGLRKRSVLENNISQTAGSAGESIAFGVGLVMPALLVLGFDIDVVRVMTVGVLGGLLGILMMIPLRRAFIVNKHGELKYPEGTACADVLKAGEKGGSTAGTLVIGLVIGFIYQFAVLGLKLLKDTASAAIHFKNSVGETVFQLKGASVGSEMSAPLLGVGFIIGPRIASVMVAGGILAYLVLVPAIVYFGEHLTAPVAPAVSSMKDGKDIGLIKNMSAGQIRNNYILYIGAGAVATGGIISMIQALPVIMGSVMAGFRDLRGGRNGANDTANRVVPRTERDLPMTVVIFGSLGMVVALAVAPSLGLGLNLAGIAGAVMILFFGFLFVTVSSRLTGEIGSSSNPISGMTVATLLLTCLILLVMSESGLITLGKEVKLLALTIAGVVCIASSNGGTTSQALKTGHLLGSTPKYQQYAILVGSLASALVVGVVLLTLNQAGTIYTKLPSNLPPSSVRVDVGKLTATDRVRTGQYASDTTEYKVLVLGDREKMDPALLSAGKPEDVKPGRYLIAADGSFAYLCDPAVNGKVDYEDSEMDKPEAERKKVSNQFDAPKTQLVALIIDGILDRNLPWGLVVIGALIALTVHLCGVSALAFAVGVYLPLSSSVPIFLGGMVRALVDKLRNKPEEGDSSPGVLLSSGYIAGGSLAALAAAAIEFMPSVKEALNLCPKFFTDPETGNPLEEPISDLHVTIAFGILAVILIMIGVMAGRDKK